MDIIKNKFDVYKKEEIEEEIKKLFELQNRNEPKPKINYEGYFRKNLNLDLEFKKMKYFQVVKKF